MVESAPKIGCNRCKVPLSGLRDPQGSDLLTCPNCRISDTYDNVMLELGQRTADALRRALYRPVPPRVYRFALLFRAVIPESTSSTQQHHSAAGDKARSLPVRLKRNRTQQRRS